MRCVALRNHYSAHLAPAGHHVLLLPPIAPRAQAVTIARSFSGQLVAVRLKFFAERPELAAPGRAHVTSSAWQPGLLRIDRRRRRLPGHDNEHRRGHNHGGHRARGGPGKNRRQAPLEWIRSIPQGAPPPARPPMAVRQRRSAQHSSIKISFAQSANSAIPRHWAIPSQPQLTLANSVLSSEARLHSL